MIRAWATGLGVIALASCTAVLGDDFEIVTTTTAGNGGTSTVSTSGQGASELCGNGMLDDPETCDDGPNNGAGQSCKADCTLNACGDGDQGPTEGCDNGMDNELALGECAPDCSKVIEKKFIYHYTDANSFTTGGDFGPDPVAFADSHCNAGEKALFAFGSTRRATTTPYVVDNPIDWVIQTYTYYYNEYDEPVFLTDDTALLGVRDGQFVGLENLILDVVSAIATGVYGDYTTLRGSNCLGWSTENTAVMHAPGGTPFTDEEFLHSATEWAGCDYNLGFYCVEQ